MANWYILAYYDELGSMRVHPQVLHVYQGDNVIWASWTNNILRETFHPRIFFPIRPTPCPQTTRVPGPPFYRRPALQSISSPVRHR